MSRAGPTTPAPVVEQIPAHPLSPAPAVREMVDGLAVTRRCRPDVDPARPSVILVHGAMDRAASFGRVMRRLPEVDVIAFDRRGYGASPATDRCPRLADHAADLRRLIEWSGAQHVALVGHSLGGTIAMNLVSERPDGVTSMGLFESPAPWLDNSFSAIGGGTVERAETDGAEAGAEFFYRMMVGDDTWTHLKQRDKEARRSEGHTLMCELASLRNPDEALAVESVAVPVIVGHGGRSSAAMTRTAALLRESLPDAWMIEINSAGHGAHLSNPDDFASFVRACVARGEVQIERGASPQDE